MNHFSLRISFSCGIHGSCSESPLLIHIVIEKEYFFTIPNRVGIMSVLLALILQHMAGVARVARVAEVSCLFSMSFFSWLFRSLSDARRSE